MGLLAPDWVQPWAQPLQPLPITTPPLPNEVPSSYVPRLAAVNGWDLLALLNHIGQTSSVVRDYTNRPDQWATGELALNTPAFERLALLSGRPVTALRQALASSDIHRRRTPDNTIPTLHWSRIYSQPARIAESRTVPACPRCMVQRGITTLVTVQVSLDQPACLRHRYWLIDDAPRPVDVASHPDLLAALTAYRNLRRRHDSHRLFTAFTTARRLCYRYRAHLKNTEFFDGLQHRWHERQHRLHASNDWLAVRYPEIVTLTSVFCSDYWLLIAAKPYRKPPLRSPRPDSRDFLHEVARRLQHPNPDKFVTASHSIGEHARSLQPAIPKLQWGYYPKPANPTDAPRAR